MSEAELMQSLMSSTQVVLSLFSMLFTMVSAYLAALYLFLNRAPLTLRVLAFVLLSVGLVFLGVAAGLQQKIQTDLLAAWAKLPAPAVTLDAFRNPVGLKLPNGLSTHQVGIMIGWGTALCVYLALGHMTFRYRWPSRYDLPVE